MPTLYLIDGNSYIYRAFYAIRNLSSSDGFPTNAIFGFTNMILKILKEKKPDYFAVTFDTPEPTVRHEEYEEYKAHRPSMPDDLRPQIQVIKDIIDAFRIVSIEKPGYEADDLLGTIARKAESEGIEVFIVTGDKDLCQVVSPMVRLYDTMKEKITEEKDVIERFGVKPSRFPEIIALMGDASDNIPGVPGVGEKTAIKLLKEFESLDDLIENYSKITRPKLRQLISENIDNIKLSLSLATIRYDVPIKLSIKDLREGEPDWDALKDFFNKFEFKSFLKILPGESGPTEADIEYITVDDEKGLERMIKSIKNEIAIDTETTSKSPILAELVGISIAADPAKAYYIPVAHSYENVPAQLPKKYVLKQLKAMIESRKIKKAGHNIKYDYIVLRNEGVTMQGIEFDTMLASYLLNPGRSNHNLDDVSMDRLGLKKISYKDVTEKGKLNFSEVPVDIATEYSGEDASATLQLKNCLAPEIKKEGLDRLFHDIEMPLIEVLADMETAGVKIDLSLMEKFSKKLGQEMESIEQRIYFLAGEEFNIHSPKQLQQILFEKIGLKPLKKTKTGYSTNMDVLEQLALEHELPKEIIEYRGLAKLRNTYVDALPKIVNRKTGRLHTSFNQTVTATGRLSSSDPNLQNIPVRGEWGKRIRKAFVAEEGHLLLSSDYSQIELRILAHLSGDEGLVDVFNNDGDVHTRAACELFDVKPDDVTPEMRRMAKIFNFGIVYGVSAYGLSRQLNISPAEAGRYIDNYFSRNPGVREYLDGLIKDAYEKGYVLTLFDRKRVIPELKSSNKNTRQFGERIATNTPIQGTAADIIKISMINIRKRLKREGLKTRMLLQVHDELLFEVPDNEKDRAAELVREEMENAVSLAVPVKVDIGIGKNWAEAH